MVVRILCVPTDIALWSAKPLNPKPSTLNPAEGCQGSFARIPYQKPLPKCALDEKKRNPTNKARHSKKSRTCQAEAPAPFEKPLFSDSCMGQNWHWNSLPVQRTSNSLLNTTSHQVITGRKPCDSQDSAIKSTYPGFRTHTQRCLNRAHSSVSEEGTAVPS